MNEPIDVGFLAAKVAALRDEKAKLFVDTASLTYNVMMVNQLMNIQRELISVCCTIDQVSRFRGYCTQEEYNVALECQRHIQECEQELVKHRTMTFFDCASLVVSGLSMLLRK